MKALLVLEDGKVFEGESFGAKGQRYGEVVFNTSMAGYQEILTDPSYKGQIVAMTYPLIGNYGINMQDAESRRIFLEGFVVKECSKLASSWRSQGNLSDYLREHGIVGIEGIDTRELTLHIREQGAMRAVVSSEDANTESLLKKVRSSRGLEGRDLVREVTNNRKYTWSKAKARGLKVVVLDCGVKYNILNELLAHGSEVTVMPAGSSDKEILKERPDGLLLSNGPGDPAAVSCVIETTRKLIGRLPIFGICLGHQMLGLALGAKTYKLKFGHHGANHPVKDLRTGRVYITVQNHGFCLDMDSLNKKDIEITHINLNDFTLEGLRHKKLPIISVQFHPEASAGPHDARCLFGEFIKMVRGKSK